MKRYFYIILTAFCELLSISSIRNYSDNSFDLLRILCLEKSALREFAFNPFPLFIMLCCLMKTILAIIFITSNILETELIISRFKSRQSYFLYLIGKQAKNVLFCSFTITVMPVIFAALLCGFFDIARIVLLYFPKQFVVLYFASGASLILREKLHSGAADITAAMMVIVMIMIDIFADIPVALIDLTEQNLLATVCETAVCSGVTFGCYVLYKRRKDII